MLEAARRLGDATRGRCNERVMQREGGATRLGRRYKVGGGSDEAREVMRQGRAAREGSQTGETLVMVGGRKEARERKRGRKFAIAPGRFGLRSKSPRVVEILPSPHFGQLARSLKAGVCAR